MVAAFLVVDDLVAVVAVAAAVTVHDHHVLLYHCALVFSSLPSFLALVLVDGHVLF